MHTGRAMRGGLVGARTFDRAVGPETEEIQERAQEPALRDERTHGGEQESLEQYRVLLREITCIDSNDSERAWA